MSDDTRRCCYEASHGCTNSRECQIDALEKELEELRVKYEQVSQALLDSPVARLYIELYAKAWLDKAIRATLTVPGDRR